MSRAGDCGPLRSDHDHDERPMNPRNVTAALLLTAAVPLAACGGSNDAGSTDDPAQVAKAIQSPAAGAGGQKLGACGSNSYPVSEPLACLTYDLTGGLTEKGTTVSSIDESKTCADWVKGTVFGGGPALKMPAPGGVTQGKFLGLSGTIANYKGAGTYQKGDLSVISADLSAPAQYEQGDSSTATMTINPDGSGSFTFGNYTGKEGASGTASGTVTWTCHDPGA